MLNLPQTITKNDGSTVVYVYSASGNKLRKLYTVGGTTTTTEYDNGIQYDNSTTNVAFIQTEEGRARHSGTTYTYEYDLKDHLGNTRVTLTPDPNDPTQQTAKILQENDYYAFGYGIQSMQQSVPSPKNEYLYNHKELQEETGLYDYGARFYDPVIGRWGSVDPLAEKDRRWSPYVYGFDNSIRFEDPDGMWPGEGFFGDAWNHTKSSFVGTFSNIKKVLTTNPVTTAKSAYHSFMGKSIGGKVEAYFNLFPGSHMIISEAKAIKSAVKGDGKGGGDFVGSQAANTVIVGATDGVLSGAAKGISALRGTAASGLGDLTTGEVRSIQKVVDQAERPLEVGGSAASGTRRGVGTDLPIGKGPGTKSDIDYLAPPSAQPYFDGLQAGLPGLDPKSGIIPGTGNPYIGPFIRFEPGAKPTFTPKTSN